MTITLERRRHPKKFHFFSGKCDDSENVYFIYDFGGTVFGRPAHLSFWVLSLKFCRKYVFISQKPTNCVYSKGEFYHYLYVNGASLSLVY